jgi:hypothetical protein
VGGYWDFVPDPSNPSAYAAHGGSALITENGDFYYLADIPAEGVVLHIGQLAASGSSLTGSQYQALVSLSHSACTPTFFCGISGPEPFSGAIQQRSTLTVASDPSGTLNFTYDSLYNQPSSLSLLAGEWQGTMSERGNSPGLLAISSSGALTQPNPLTDCTLQGEFSIINPMYNAYAVTYDASGTDCALPGSHAQGLAMLDTTQSPVQLNIAVIYYDSSGNPQGMMFYSETAEVQAGVWTASTSGGGTALLLASGIPVDWNPPAIENANIQGLNFYLQMSASNCSELYIGGLSGGPGTMAGSYSIAADTTFNSNPAGPASGCAPNDAGSLMGSVVPENTLSAVLSSPSSSQQSVSFVFDPIYNVTSSLASLAGSWANIDGSSIVIQSDGTFIETNPVAPYSGCSVNGQLYILDPDHNLYMYEMVWSSCPSGPGQNGLTVVGLLTLDNSATPNQLIGGGESSIQITGQSGSIEAQNVSFLATRQ